MNAWDRLQQPNVRAVAVVAHPDDESLWCGGLIVRCRVDWTIICCSLPYGDPQRAVSFFDACEALSAKGRMVAVRDRPDELFDHLDLIDLSGYDVIVTHGAEGEYGHPHHVQVHDYVSARWPLQTLSIGYRQAGHGQHQIKLSKAEWQRKLAALKCYSHKADHDHGRPKWRALILKYGEMFDLKHESYDCIG